MLSLFKVKNKEKLDISKRDFLKALGSLSLGAFIFFLFSKKAQALSFGSTGLPDPVGVKHFSGAGADFSITLTSADTAYQVPASGSVPAKDYILSIYNGSDADVFWGWSSDIGATPAKRKIIPSGGTMNIDLAANQYFYLVCGSAGKVIAYSTKERD